MSELPEIMESLDIQDQQEGEEVQSNGENPSCRVLRKRSPKISITKIIPLKGNRRFNLQPKKLVNGKHEDIVEYYLNKKVSRFRSSLETIFEVPKIDNNGKSIYLGPNKLRQINFNGATKGKIKKRKVKVKSVIGGNSKKKISKLSMDVFHRRLNATGDADQQ